MVKAILAMVTIMAMGCQSTFENLPSTPEQTIDRTASVDLYRFVLPSFQSNKQLGSIAYRNEGNVLYMFSWTAKNPQNYVTIMFDMDIWLIEDRTWGHSQGKFYQFKEGLLWLRRYMRIGESVTNTQIQDVFSEDDCVKVNTRAFFHEATLVDHRYQDLGGDLGIREVVEVSSAGEGYLYAIGLGLVGWHDRAGGAWTFNNNWSTVEPPIPRPKCKP